MNIRKYKKDRQGFSLLETVFSTVLVSMLLVVSMTTLSNVMRTRNTDTYQLRAVYLGKLLLSEAMAKPFISPDDNSAALGASSAELAGPRSDWNDFDDYHGLNMAVLVDADGNVLPDTTGWSAVISGAYADPNNPTIAFGAATDLKKLTLTLTDPNGTNYTFEAFKSRFGLLQEGQNSDLLSSVEATASLNSRYWVSSSRIKNQQELP